MNIARKNCKRCGAGFFDDGDIYCPECDVEAREIDLARGIDHAESPVEVRRRRSISQINLRAESEEIPS